MGEFGGATRNPYRLMIPTYHDLKNILTTILVIREEWLENNNLIMNRTKTMITLFFPTNSGIAGS